MAGVFGGYTGALRSMDFVVHLSRMGDTRVRVIAMCV